MDSDEIRHVSIDNGYTVWCQILSGSVKGNWDNSSQNVKIWLKLQHLAAFLPQEWHYTDPDEI